MNNKNLIFILIIFALGFLLVINASAKKKETSKNWIKEVEFIITEAEKAEFAKLKRDKDMENFINLFWAKRDPTPQTEHNEFREEYYRRLEHVKKSFIYGYNTGIETDMGKVYIRLGKPLKVFPQGTNTEIWTYPTPSWIDYPKEALSIVFSHDGTGFVIDRSRTDSRLIQAMYSYPNVVLLYPDLKAIPEYKHIKAFSTDSFEGKLIQQVESTGESVIQIPSEKKVLFTKAKNLSSYLTFLLKIAPTMDIPDRLTIFGRLKSDVYSADFRQEKNLTRENDYFIVQVGMPVLPGEYDLFVGLCTKDKKIYSLEMGKISVPNFWTKEFAISSLIASPEVQARQSFREKEYNIFSVGNYSLSPVFTQEYTPEQFLNVFYYIYNFGVDSNQNCSLLIEFELQKGEQKFNLNPQKSQRKVEEGTVLLEGTRIPLSVLKEPGEYMLTVKITDEVANKAASQRLTFTVK